MKPGKSPQPGLKGSPAKAKSKTQLQDDSIMGTNNSSIVSKRSVERLYFPHEPEFFRFFVKKPQRRSPLINRGYWLRMRAVDQTVKRFLEQPSEKSKVVINLGCGYDPLPWQSIARYKAACDGVTFVDIDYRDLMLKKRAVVQSTEELNSFFTGMDVFDADVLLRSNQYLQIGCDLRDLSALDRILRDAVDVENSFILFTAEVSITYMNVDAADQLIKWCGTLPDARFCLLEQLLPNGMEHPFAQTMMAHFDKLQTPLRAVQKYPTTATQQQRFQNLGWADVAINNLWELWNNTVSQNERLALDGIEPFDEWEEFALFGTHYFLLVANTSESETTRNILNPVKSLPSMNTEYNGDKMSTKMDHCIQSELRFEEYPKSQGCRRFAAAIPLKSSHRGSDGIGIFGGMGLNSRLNSFDEYATDVAAQMQPMEFNSPSIPSSRMCHTVTNMEDSGALLIGGRTSPDNALADCWLYHKYLGVWERVDDLPWPLFRHQAVLLGQNNILVSTGRVDSQSVSDKFLVWSRSRGWVNCHFGDGERPVATYGAVFTDYYSETLTSTSAQGIIAGGMSVDGELQQTVWMWKVQDYLSSNPIITFKPLPILSGHNLVSRFGANTLRHHKNIYILGGIIKNQLLSLMDEICTLQIGDSTYTISSVIVGNGTAPRPLLIGTTLVKSEESLIVMGGSAVCFSFGTFWNKGCYTITTLSRDAPVHTNTSVTASNIPAPGQRDVWKFLRTITLERSTAAQSSVVTNPTVGQCATSTPRVRVESASDFESILRSNSPVVIESLNIGTCTSKWTPEYLRGKIGIDREVIVHEATEDQMDFKSKNFAYVSKRFGLFMDEIESGRRLYLRSLSSEKPAEQPTNINTDFPSIQADFQLPPALSVVTQNVHSSPLRISGPVAMWLHYDVMANVLCQIRGTKKLLLFPPSDIRHFKFEPGASSSDANCFDLFRSGSLGHTHPHEAIMKPGDVLFLPPLWLHTATPTSSISVSVNVFFRNLSTGYSTGKDVYGNRDLQAYEKGRQDIAKIIKSFESLPLDAREFYLQRLADEFKQNSV